MRLIFHLFPFLILLSLYGCFELPEPRAHESPSNKTPAVRDHDMHLKCGFEPFLNDPQIPEMAKQLVLSRYYSGTDEPLKLFGYLNTKHLDTRMFYLKAITKISDRYFSEELSHLSAEYVLKHTKDFISCFEYTGCFSETDLQIWADNVASHLKFNDSANKKAAMSFNAKVLANCKGCKGQQQKMILLFADMLEENWNNYLGQ